jgi:hypothetical protein
LEGDNHLTEEAQQPNVKDKLFNMIMLRWNIVSTGVIIFIQSKIINIMICLFFIEKL